MASIFKEYGCSYVSGEYKNNKSKFIFECSCGNIHSKTLPKFKNSPRCNECALISRSIKNRVSYEDIYKMFSEKGCILLTKKEEYVDQNTAVDFICSCKRNGRIKPKDYKQSAYGKCKKCGFESRANVHLYNFESICDFVKNNSTCILLSKEYISSTAPLKFQCHCGSKFTTSFINFKHENKRQCNKCGIAMRSKENAPMWKGGITPEHQKIRSSTEYKNWRDSVYSRDKYSCQCCLDSSGGNLQAHHIENFSVHEDLRFEISNGITLCIKCHDFGIIDSFHHKYGTKNNTKEQLIEYITSKRQVLGISGEMPFLLQN